LIVPARRIASVTALGAAGASRRPRRAVPDTDGHEALVGTLVHRLLARRLPVETDAARVRALMRDGLRPDESTDVADEDALVGRAAALYSSLRTRAEVVALLGAGDWYTEVPFSYVPPERPETLIRGVIDAVVLSPDGTRTVVEFKTGAPRPEHDAQAAIYARALADALGSGPVAVRILYA
jgi:ATP-dependent exoDNAse (exonuclease V) beta subunit